MRLHSDTLNRQDILNALPRGCYAEVLSQHGSRSHSYAYEVQLSGSSPYSAQSGQWKAATYEEWGQFLQTLFDLDPTGKYGPYNGRRDFIDSTTRQGGYPFLPAREAV